MGLAARHSESHFYYYYVKNLNRSQVYFRITIELYTHIHRKRLMVSLGSGNFPQYDKAESEIDLYLK